LADNAGVSRWIKVWLRAWRSEPLVLVSPLPVPVVRARVIEGSTSYLRAAFRFGSSGGSHIVGRVGTRRISLEAVTAGQRNSWRPMMRGRLDPEEAGSRLVGTLGWSPFVKAFSALWFSVIGCAFLGLVIRAVAMAWGDDASVEAFLICLAPLGFALLFIGLTAWGIQAGRRQAMYLRSWLADRMQTKDADVSRYRPWQGNTAP
jgi:hypothetical protein